jgi:pyruvate dehydrogenase (quinone)
LAADCPVVLEVKTDPEIAPLPPHISLKEAKNFMSSMRRDDKAVHVLRDTARQVINAVLRRNETD